MSGDGRGGSRLRRCGGRGGRGLGGRGKCRFVPEKVDPVGSDPEDLPRLEEEPGDPPVVRVRPVPAPAIRQEVLAPDAEDPGVDPRDGRIRKEEVGVAPSPDPDLFEPEADLDGHAGRDGDGQPGAAFGGNHRDTSGVFPGLSKGDAEKIPYFRIRRIRFRIARAGR
jgi:hypothetical protein